MVSNCMSSRLLASCIRRGMENHNERERNTDRRGDTSKGTVDSKAPDNSTVDSKAPDNSTVE
jgi:hypothetical protein